MIIIIINPITLECLDPNKPSLDLSLYYTVSAADEFWIQPEAGHINVTKFRST